MDMHDTIEHLHSKVKGLKQARPRHCVSSNASHALVLMSTESCGFSSPCSSAARQCCTLGFDVIVALSAAYEGHRRGDEAEEHNGPRAGTMGLRSIKCRCRPCDRLHT